MDSILATTSMGCTQRIAKKRCIDDNDGDNGNIDINCEWKICDFEF